jgi:hypothetical protein
MMMAMLGLGKPSDGKTFGDDGAHFATRAPSLSPTFS